MTHIFDTYEGYLQFKCNFHNILISLCAATGKKKEVPLFCITERDIMDEVANWSDKHRPPILKGIYEFELSVGHTYHT